MIKNLLVFVLAFSAGWLVANEWSRPVVITVGIPRNSPVNTTVRNEKKDSFLFAGDGLGVLEDKSGLEIRALKGKRDSSCLAVADERLGYKFSRIENIGLTGYFRVIPYRYGIYDTPREILGMSVEQFAKLSPEGLRELDETMRNTLDSEMFFLKNNRVEYLMVIGHETATSGIGHYYSTHTLVPLDPTKQVIEFSSISSDPRRVKISQSGSVYYARIEDGKDNPVQSGRRRLDVSLMSVEKESKVVYSFDFVCKNVNTIL